MLVFGASGLGRDGLRGRQPRRAPASACWSPPAATSATAGPPSAPTTASTPCTWRASGAGRSTPPPSPRRWRASPASRSSSSPRARPRRGWSPTSRRCARRPATASSWPTPSRASASSTCPWTGGGSTSSSPGSQKGLMTPPGLAFVAANERAVARSAGLGARRLLPRLGAHPQGRLAQPLHPARDARLPAPGGPAPDRGRGAAERLRPAPHARAHVRAPGSSACGLSLLGPENPEANVVTAFLVPEGVDGKAIPAGLKSRFGIQIAGGQGKLSGKICRIGHCGYYDYRDILTALGALEIVLADLGQPVELGAGVAAAQRVAADAADASSRAGPPETSLRGPARPGLREDRRRRRRLPGRALLGRRRRRPVARRADGAGRPTTTPWWCAARPRSPPT